MSNIDRRGFIGHTMLGALAMSAATMIPAYANNVQNAPRLQQSNKNSLLLKNVKITGQETLMDLLVIDGKINKIAQNINDPSVDIYDAKGALLLPSFVDAHVHLDKTRIGAEHRLHHVKTASVAERAMNERRLRVEMNHDPLLFGSNLIEQMALCGTTHIRSHIDIDSSIQLKHVEALLKLKDKYKGFMDIELVAFPQSGIVKDPGVAQLLDQAMGMGVDIVGGLDPQVFDNDLNGHLDIVFNIAEKYGSRIDLHIHEPGEIGLKTFNAIIDRAKVLDMKDKITLSHAFALGQITPEQLNQLLPKMADLGISVITTAPGDVEFPPMGPLMAANVLYSAASDNIQDFWSPWGTGDQLERAMFLARKEGYRIDEPLMQCFQAITQNPAKLLGLSNHGLAYIKEGESANFTALMAEDVGNAILQRSERLFTMKDGRLTMLEGTIYS